MLNVSMWSAGQGFNSAVMTEIGSELRRHNVIMASFPVSRHFSRPGSIFHFCSLPLTNLINTKNEHDETSDKHDSLFTCCHPGTAMSTPSTSPSPDKHDSLFTCCHPGTAMSTPSTSPSPDKHHSLFTCCHPGTAMSTSSTSPSPDKHDSLFTCCHPGTAMSTPSTSPSPDKHDSLFTCCHPGTAMSTPSTSPSPDKHDSLFTCCHPGTAMSTPSTSPFPDKHHSLFTCCHPGTTMSTSSTSPSTSPSLETKQDLVIGGNVQGSANYEKELYCSPADGYREETYTNIQVQRKTSLLSTATSTGDEQTKQLQPEVEEHGFVNNRSDHVRSNKMKTLLDVLQSLAITMVPRQYHAKEFRIESKEIFCKNLFLKDRKSQFYLIICHEDEEIDFKKLKTDLKAYRNFSFAKPNDLKQVLQVEPGAITPFALMFPSARDITVAFTKRLIRNTDDLLNFHPLDPNLTLPISFSDLQSFLRHFNFKIKIIDA